MNRACRHAIIAILASFCIALLAPVVAAQGGIGGGGGNAGNVGEDDDDGGIVIDGATLEIRAVPAVDSEVEPGTLDALLGAFELDAIEGGFELDTLTVAAGGDGDPLLDLTRVALAHDTDGNASYDPGTDVVLDEGMYGGDLTITFDLARLTGQPLVIAPEGLESVLLLVDVSMRIPEGTEIRGRITGESGIETGEGSSIYVTDGLPAESRTLIALPAVDPEVRVERRNPSDREVAAGSADVVVGGYRIAAAGREFAIGDISIAARGDMRVTVDLLGVALVHDVNGDGQFAGAGESGGDVPLDTGVFTEENGTLSLSAGGLVVARGGSAQVLLVATFAESALPGTMIGFTLEGLVAPPDTPVLGLPAESATIWISSGSESEGGDGTDGDQSGNGDDDAPDDLLIATATGCSVGVPAGGSVALATLLMLALITRRRR